MTFTIDRAVIEVNGGCNYSCSMCPQDMRTGGRHKGFLKKMSLQEFEDNVADCAKHGLRVVNLDGSGEATLNRDLPKYIEIVKKYNARAVIFSNGHNMENEFMMDCVDAGLDFYRFSWIGSNPEKYDEWMYNRIGGDYGSTWDKVRKMKEYVDLVESDCVVATYHLMTETDPEKREVELEAYKNIVNTLGVKTEIWTMHNWSGVYKPVEDRKGAKKTCGRPFSPDLVIRAGGLDNKRGAVHPCCQVLGRDEQGILGYTSENTVEEIFFGEEYEKLREQHRSGDYPEFCRDCDFLVDDPEVLVWTNHERDLYKMYGTEFDLDDYR